jgi:hypothetical protein
MSRVPSKERKWKKFSEVIRKTIRSSHQLSNLINKYLSEKDVTQKKIISQRIDSQFKKGL